MRRILTLALIAVAWFWTSALALPNEISYEIQARLDTKEHKLYGNERILFTSKADKPLTELYLHLWPNRFSEGSVQAREMGQLSFDVLFPNGPDYGYLFIQELKLDGKEIPYTIDDTILKINLETPIAPDQTAEIAVKFIVKIPHALERLGHDQGNYYISWWYPKLSVYDSKGWHPDVAHAFGASEPYEDFAHYSVELTVPSNFVVGATGQLYRETVNPDGTKTLTYIADNVHDFAWVADARYQSETVQWEDVTIISLYFPEDAAAGKRAAQYAKDALEYFSRRFGRYPYPNFTVAEIRGLGFAMEYPQMIHQSYMLYRIPELFTVLDSVTAHETAHQWFYGIFMNNQLEETWLDEGFATFAEMSYIEHKYGTAANSFNTLWLKSQGLGFLTEILKESNSRTGLLRIYTRVAREGREAPLSTPLHKVPSGKTVMPYQKGALLLFALENLVGIEKFDQIMQEYYRRYRFRQVTAEDFIKTAEDVSGRDLKEFFTQWLTTTKTLDVSVGGMISQKIENKHVTRVIVSQQGEMRIPIDAEATLADGTRVRQRWEMLDKRGTLTFVTDTPVKSVTLDPDKVLPDLDRSDNFAPRGLDLSPWLDHGMLHGRPDDGLILGIRLTPLYVGWAFGLQRFVFKQEMKRSFCFADRCTSEWAFTQKDDGHIFANDGAIHFRWHHDRTDVQLSLSALYHNRYDVARDPGRIFSVGMSYERRSRVTRLTASYTVGLATWGGEYAFQKFSWSQEIRARLWWQTLWVQRTVWGWREGRAPEERDFNLKDFAGFRAFDIQSDWVFAQSNELRLPIPALNKIDIGPIPFSVGAIAFVNMAILKAGQHTVRAEAGLGVTVGFYGSPIVYVEYPLWVNTHEGAQLGWSVRFEREFRFGL